MLPRMLSMLVCALLLAACQQSGLRPSSLVGVTGPSSTTMKAVDVPFSGVVTGGLAFNGTLPNCNAPAFVNGVSNATGTALHMGNVTYHTEQCITKATGAIDGRVLVLTAANGDEIHGTFTGKSESSGQVGDTFHVTGTFVFNGGTGRFEHATGSAEMTAELTHTATFPFPGRWEWKGTIRY